MAGDSTINYIDRDLVEVLTMNNSWGTCNCFFTTRESREVLEKIPEWGLASSSRLNLGVITYRSFIIAGDTPTLIYNMNGIEYLVKHSDIDTLMGHESLPYEVAKTLSILSNDEDCHLELPRNTVWGKEMDKWEFQRSRGVVDGYTCFTGYSSKYPDGLIMTANGWICNLFNHYTKTL